MKMAKPTSILAFMTALVPVLVTAMPAQACRAYRFPNDMIRAPHDAAAIVRIEKVSIGVKGEVTDIQTPWQAHAIVVAEAFGDAVPNEVDVGRSGASSACDDGEPAPETGDIWVVYFWKQNDGNLVPTDSYPLSLVKAVDPTFEKFKDR